MKILLFVLALWAFMSIAPSDGRNVRRYYGPKGTICKKGHHWIVKIKCTNKCKIHKPKAAFESGGRVRITGRMGKAFRQKKKSCGRNCFCAKTSKPRWNQVFCKNHRGKKITSNRVHFDIWCIKRTTKLRFRAYVRDIGKPKMMGKTCENGKYHDGTTCQACNCGTEGSKFQSCKTTTGKCNCKDEYKGDKCDQCKDKFYKPTGQQVCSACNCDARGSNGLKCADNSGFCNCKSGIKLPKCDSCFSSLKKVHDDGKCRVCDNGKYLKNLRCLDCTCDPNGAKFKSCETTTGDCDCKVGYKDKDCNNCEDGYYKDAVANVCKACNCVLVNTVGGNDKTCGPDGQCNCVPGKTTKDCSS